MGKENYIPPTPEVRQFTSGQETNSYELTFPDQKPNCNDCDYLGQTYQPGMEGIVCTKVGDFTSSKPDTALIVLPKDITIRELQKMQDHGHCACNLCNLPRSKK